MSNLHAYGYEALEESDRGHVEEQHVAVCHECDWKSEPFDGLSWKDAEEALIEHMDEEHPEDDEDDEDVDDD